MVFGEIYKKSDLKLTFKRHPSEVGLNKWQQGILARKVIELSNTHNDTFTIQFMCLHAFYFILWSRPTQLLRQTLRKNMSKASTNVLETCEVSKYIQYDVWDTES